MAEIIDFEEFSKRLRGRKYVAEIEEKFVDLFINTGESFNALAEVVHAGFDMNSYQNKDLSKYINDGLPFLVLAQFMEVGLAHMNKVRKLLDDENSSPIDHLPEIMIFQGIYLELHILHSEMATKAERYNTIRKQP